MATANVRQLAAISNLPVPADPDAAVAAREKELGGEEFPSILFSTIAVTLLGVALGAALLIQLFAFLRDGLLGPSFGI